MNYNEAKETIALHAGNEIADGKFLEDGFLPSLRPFLGQLYDKNFHQLFECILVVGKKISVDNKVDKDLMGDLFDLCRLTRLWGLEEQGMLRRNNLISDGDIEKLGVWQETIENATSLLLGGASPEYVSYLYAKYLLEYDPGHNIDFFIHIFCSLIEEEQGDVFFILLDTLCKLGPKAKETRPFLEKSLYRRYNWYSPEKKCQEEALKKIHLAIEAVSHG